MGDERDRDLETLEEGVRRICREEITAIATPGSVVFVKFPSPRWEPPNGMSEWLTSLGIKVCYLQPKMEITVVKPEETLDGGE